MQYYEMKSYRFQVAEDTELELINDIPNIEFDWFSVNNKKIQIKKGYAWDGASGPTINTKDTIKAYLIHDCLYQAMRLGIVDESNRKTADKELRDQMIKAGCWKIRAYIWYIMVRLFGTSSAKKGNLQGKEIKQSC